MLSKAQTMWETVFKLFKVLSSYIKIKGMCTLTCSAASSLFRSTVLGLPNAWVTTYPQQCCTLLLLKGIGWHLFFFLFSLINGHNSRHLTKSSHWGNILTPLWLTPVTVDLSIIISHVVPLFSSGNSTYTWSALSRALYSVTVADFLHLSHFVQVHKVIGAWGVSV